MRRLFATLIATLLLSHPAQAQTKAPTAQSQAGQPAPAGPKLGEELTAMGAIRAGNQARSVPPWTGGLSAPVREFEPGKHHPNPFVEDVLWFTVKAGELRRYEPRLSGGLKALLRRYPDSFEIRLFPSRRTAAAPQRLYDESIANAARAGLSDNGLVLNGAKAGVPFPVPANGAQAMWNHILRWRGETLSRTGTTVISDGQRQLATSVFREDRLSGYSAGQEGRPFHYRRTQLEPEAEAGTTLLLQGTLDPLRVPRAAWFRQGERGKPMRAAEFAHDTPDPAAGGIRTADMLDMFSGPLDRLDFTLLDKRREMYVPYNAYRLNAPNLTPRDFLWPNHPNPEFLRYELHRVWVVEAAVKAGLRDAFPERTYYLDEDSWQILMADYYDAEGNLARYGEAHGIAHSQVPAFLPAMEITYDLTDGRYVASGLDNQHGPPVFGKPMKPEEFAPETLLRKGRRQ
ncbi:DUF1329 domain-containing protein [Azospirillum sp. SYSU D00513]|uniref:DUF1329 domain-containing protein n=2 Tax=Pseudomonadati TaxID=3379134 RepID=UPI001A960273|nr:DUF1329 domain-containing protein [Azospirillum sp. SYSU D00513]